MTLEAEAFINCNEILLHILSHNQKRHYCSGKIFVNQSLKAAINLRILNRTRI